MNKLIIFSYWNEKKLIERTTAFFFYSSMYLEEIQGDLGENSTLKARCDSKPKPWCCEMTVPSTKSLHLGITAQIKAYNANLDHRWFV